MNETEESWGKMWRESRDTLKQEDVFCTQKTQRCGLNLFHTVLTQLAKKCRVML